MQLGPERDCNSQPSDLDGNKVSLPAPQISVGASKSQPSALQVEELLLYRGIRCAFTKIEGHCSNRKSCKIIATFLDL